MFLSIKQFIFCSLLFSQAYIYQMFRHYIILDMETWDKSDRLNKNHVSDKLKLVSLQCLTEDLAELQHGLQYR